MRDSSRTVPADAAWLQGGSLRLSFALRAVSRRGEVITRWADRTPVRSVA